MKSITEYLKYLYSLERSSMKYDLNNIRRLLNSIGNPHHSTKYIHIAGTNGKGGTASFLASILKEHGFKTGLFTSPHILKFNERIRINGKPIPDSYIRNFLEKNKELIKKVKPSFFEVNTALAFKYFTGKKVDIAVIEAGLGGRLDSTNIVKPELIIITQIEIDHTDYLGKTLLKIAKEKLGIVKPGIDIIVSDTNRELKKLFKSKIKPEHLFLLNENVFFQKIDGDRENTVLRVSGKNLTVRSPVYGKYQLRNIGTAILGTVKYFQKAGEEFSVNAAQKGIKRVRENSGYRCRFETVKKNGISYIFDISHNPAGIKSALGNFSAEKPEVIIFAMMNDKDYKTSIKAILSTGSKIIFTQPAYNRSLKATELYNFAVKNSEGKKDRIFVKPVVKDAVLESGKLSRKKGTVLIIGSFFLVSEAIKALKLQKLFK
jgi:dihydrofolate synthase/folylpolyglutamate synthase